MTAEKQDLLVFPLPYAIFSRDKPVVTSVDEEKKQRDAVTESCNEAQKVFSVKAEVRTFERESYPRPGYLAVQLTGSGSQITSAKRWLIQRHPKQVNYDFLCAD